MASTNTRPEPGPPNKADFANSVRRFANRVLPRRSERILALVSICAFLFCGLSGPFGTFGLPLAHRFLFWGLLIGLNAFLWAVWYRWRLRDGRGWQRVAFEGGILYALPMPAEIAIAGQIVGMKMGPHWPGIWLYTVALAGMFTAVLLVAFDVLRRPATPKGVLWREGFGEGTDLAMIRAEDHFCRVADRNGREKLIYARFADLENEVAHLDGMVVRRGCWVAAKAVSAVARDGRRWIVNVGNAERVAVPESKIRALRDAGWI